MSHDQPPDFDWVTARAKCSLDSMYETLRGLARATIETRNAMLDRSADGRLFAMSDHPSERGFLVSDARSATRRSVEVVLKDGVFMFSHHHDRGTVRLVAMRVLTDAGECRLKVGEEVLDPWQVLKRALEPLYFRPTE